MEKANVQGDSYYGEEELVTDTWLILYWLGSSTGSINEVLRDYLKGWILVHLELFNVIVVQYPKKQQLNNKQALHIKVSDHKINFNEVHEEYEGVLKDLVFQAFEGTLILILGRVLQIES